MIRDNHKPHLSKELRKAIILRSRNKTKSNVDIATYKKQWNCMVALKQKLKYNYFNNLDASKGV